MQRCEKRRRVLQILQLRKGEENQIERGETMFQSIKKALCAVTESLCKKITLLIKFEIHFK